MSIRNAHWYSLNASRDYPVDEMSSCMPDSGDRLPTDILVDLRLRWPSYLGRYAFLSGVSVTPYAVSLTFQAGDTWGSTLVYSPLGSVTVLLSELQHGRAYAITPFVSGVYGYVAFGGGVDRPYQGRFSSPAQAWLAPRAARPYTLPPVTGMRMIGSDTSLTGLVLLKGQSPVEVVKESREIGGIEQDCVVIRLVGDPTSTENVFDTYAGPCGKRPESKNCGDPQPIEYINAVAPDCDGVLTLEFQGCSVAGQIVDDADADNGGAVIDCALGLHDACMPPYLPDTTGRLPIEFAQYLISAGESESYAETDTTLNETIQTLGELPYTECFKDGVADNFSVKSGEFVFERDTTRPACPATDSKTEYVADYVYTSLQWSVPNISVWEGFDISTLYRSYSVQLMLKTLDDYAGLSGGIVINHRPHQTAANQSVYYFAALELNRLVLYYFDGVNMQTLASTPVTAAADVWYTMTVKTSVVAHSAVIEVSFTGATSGSLPPVNALNYAPDTGSSGVGSYHGVARFASFQVDLYTG